MNTTKWTSVYANGAFIYAYRYPRQAQQAAEQIRRSYARARITCNITFKYWEG